MKKLNVFNMRLGLACNSSSSHSILVLKDKTQKVSTDEYEGFHWEYFTAADFQSKNNYLKAAVTQVLESNLPSSIHQEFLSKFFDEQTIASDASIDHQSVPLIPLNHQGRLNELFIKDFQDFLRRPDVVITGGNDNDEETHHLAASNPEFFSDYPTETDSSNWIARKDTDKDFWVLFNKISGSKLRFSFNSEAAPIKASVPELVDIKITDYCPYACEFCYQDSTLEGQHATMENMKNILKKLSEAEVLEIAYGGGETTLHPNFIEIIKATHDAGIVANFTTKNFNLLRSTQAEEIVKYTGAIAFSVESVLDVEKVYTSLLDYRDNQNHKLQSDYYRKSLINLQYVMGTTSLDEFKNILLATGDSSLNITLLGYKENGRGSSFSAMDYSNWLEVLKSTVKEMNDKDKYPNISIDTALAGQYKQELEDAGVSTTTFHTSEGTFSMYLDAVKNTMAPSSYIGLDQSKQFDDNWLESYKSMGIEAPNEKPKKKIRIK